MTSSLSDPFPDQPAFIKAVAELSLDDILFVCREGYEAFAPLAATSEQRSIEIMSVHGDEVVEEIAERQCGMSLERPVMDEGESWGKYCHRLICIALEGWCNSIDL